MLLLFIVVSGVFSNHGSNDEVWGLLVQECWNVDVQDFLLVVTMLSV